MSDATADKAARAAMVDQLAANAVVEAGAGSGKTTAIVQRVGALVEAGVPIESIVAITFTEAAAAELRARLREQLEATVAERGGAAARCATALDGLDDAAVTTVHGWARRLLAEFPLEAGIPPRFDVLDEVQTSIERARSWRAVLDDLLADPHLERSVAALDAGRYRLWQLREAYETIGDHLDRLDPPAAGTPIHPVTVDLNAVDTALEVATTLGDQCTAADDRLLDHLHVLDDARRRLRSCSNDLDQLEMLCENGWGCSSGRKEHWPDKEVVVAAVRAVASSVDNARRAAIDAAVANVISRIVDHAHREAERRRRAGELEFVDLLVLARRLLRTSAPARRRLHDRISTVIIDEFQDTDPIQIELAALVATDRDDVGHTPWWELPIPPGRLVVVGDPKQSIYRFRRADLRVFRHVFDVHHEQRLAFSTNFRSRPGILAWVDACIGAQIGEGSARDPDLQADPAPMQPARSVDGAAPPVILLGAEHETPIHDAREREADDLADLLCEVADGRWTVEDRDGALRPARLGDVAILVPTRVTLPYLEHALAAADIPMRIESETLVLATDAVRDLLVVLEAVVDPNDAVAVVGALRTPALACRDDDLARHAIGGHGWNYLEPIPESSPAAVRDGLELLRHFHRDLALTTVDGAVEQVIRVGRFLELGLAHRRPRDHWRRVLHVADLARAFIEAGGSSLREFVAWLRDRADHELRTVEVPVPEPDDDAVRVLTIHGAKGLEFPITVLSGLNVADREGGAPVLWRDGREPVLTGSGIRPSDYDALAAAEKAADAAEAVRLLYVGATRARDHLVVSVHRTSRGTCAARRLAERSAEVASLWRSWSPSDRSEGAHLADPVGFDLRAWQANHDRVVAGASRTAAVAATTLAHVDELEPRLGVADDGGRGRGRAATAVGRAVHAVLQTIDLATGVGIEAAARAQALAEGIPDHEARVVELTRAALRSPIVEAAVASGGFWREVPVVARIDGTIVEGFVDLLVETADGLVVVDYKTDQVGIDAEIDARMERYRVQGATYALALESALDRPVARCVFVFVREPEPVEREVDDLKRGISTVRERLLEIA